MENNYPDPIATDAPSPEDVDGDTVDTSVRYYGGRWIAADHDGERYCIECASIEYLKHAVDDPYSIPYGGPVPDGAEIDCPGASCGNCLRRIEGFTVLHYEGVCNPDWCAEAQTAE